MIGWLKRLVAGRELDELERWRVECGHTRRWLAEFPDVVSALDHLSAAAAFGYGNISKLRDEMRVRMNQRLAMLAPVVMLEAREAEERERARWSDLAKMMPPHTATGADLDRLADLPPIDSDEARRRWFGPIPGGDMSKTKFTPIDESKMTVTNLDVAHHHVASAGIMTREEFVRRHAEENGLDPDLLAHICGLRALDDHIHEAIVNPRVPTRFDGIVPAEPGRVDYRFLGVTGEES